MYQELNKEIRDLKHDLINNKIENSKLEYRNWILENKHLLYPSKLNKSVAYDVKVNPDKYIKYSFYINQQIETLGYKPYQVIPQRNNITPKHITINTPAIVDLIDDKKQKIFNYNFLIPKISLNKAKYTKSTVKDLTSSAKCGIMCRYSDRGQYDK